MKQSTLKFYRANRLRITDIRKAVAKECLIYNDTSKQRINEITKIYLTQLKKDGFYAPQNSTANSNATKVNLFIESYESNEFNT